VLSRAGKPNPFREKLDQATWARAVHPKPRVKVGWISPALAARAAASGGKAVKKGLPMPKWRQVSTHADAAKKAPGVLTPGSTVSMQSVR